MPMKSEYIRPEAVVDEPAAEVPNVPDDIYSDTPSGEDIPVLTLGDTGVDAPVLISDEEDAAVEISDAREVDEGAEENADGVVTEDAVDGSDADELADESVAEIGADETVVEDAVTEISADETVDTPDDVAEIEADDAPSEEAASDTTEDTEDDTETVESESDNVTEDAPSLSDDVAAEPVPTKAKDTAKEAKPHREEKKRNDKDKVGERRVDGLFDFIELFVFTLAIVLFVTSFFVRQSVVDGDSMLGTLHDKETLLISDFLYEPKRGDIVVVDDRSAYHVPIIKRVIAVGGDTVRITKVGVIVNGELLDEPYVYTDGGKYEYRVEYRDIADVIKGYETLKYKDGEYYEFVVPEGKIFVMGDHRNASTDSRDIGPVDVDAVLGRVIYRVLPFSVFGPVK